ncbi:MAG: sensor domain-containing protein [Dehalococcoidales bacterium]|nr:MAG: sensor domain-containing protein [Dehalococcoidales bacterium]
MIKTIEEYLSQLKKALSGCDRATIQDALSDAEEYLRTALDREMVDTTLSEAEALSLIVEKYGSPEETAAAYREIESRLTPALGKTQPQSEKSCPATIDQKGFIKSCFGVFTDPVTWGSFLYLMVSLATGIFYFTWVITGLSLSGGLLILIIGLPFLGLFILSVRGIGLVEGRIVEALLGVRMPRRQPFSRRNVGWWERFKVIITDKQTWFTIVYMILMLPLGTIYFSVFITLIALTLSGFAIPVLQLGYDIPVVYINGIRYFLHGWMLPFTVIGGILLGIITLHLARYTGRMHGALAKAMLVRL